MSDRKKQKFSLSDIIRKLNESAQADSQAISQSSPGSGDGVETVTPQSANPAPIPLKPLPAIADSNPRPRIFAPPSPDSEPAAANSLDAATNRQPAPVSPFHDKQRDVPDASLEFSKHSDDAESNDFDIMRYVGIVLRRKTVIIAALIVGCFFSVNTYVKAIRFYTAHARMLFSPGYQDIMG
ncbi:MAG TPA: hypothetical protein VF335_03525, partial [Chitinivibrionales bacterium]